MTRCHRKATGALCLRLLLLLMLLVGGTGLITNGAARAVAAAGQPVRGVPPDLPAAVSADWWATVREQLASATPVGSSLSPSPDWSADSDQANAEFGISVATAGDVNNDGYDDVIVGAWQYDYGGATDSGRVYAYYGSDTGLSTSADWVANPPKVEWYGYFGVVVGTAGDVNGDGYDDIIVGMTNYNGGSADDGAVFVWHGSDTGLGPSYNWMAMGNALYAHLGWDAGAAGDVNGDGYDDIIAGAYRYDSAGASHAYVWYGSDTGLGANGTPANANWSATTDQNLSAFGTHVGSAGDVNGDGYGDVFVGAPEYDNGETNEGVVFVWYGSDTGLGTNGTPSNADWQAESNQADGQLSGRWNSAPQEGAVGTAGDVNGDGYDDFLAGANLYDDPETDEGAVFLWYGSAGGLGDDGSPANADWWAVGDQANGWFGSAAGTIGDANGDGYDDIVVGACFYQLGTAAAWLGSGAGLGEPGTIANADWSVGSGQSGSYFAWAAATAGDVNGDGRADVIVGAHRYDNPENNEGSAFVYYGRPDGPIEGLAAANDGPTWLGNATTLTATITSGNNVTYTWGLQGAMIGTGPVLTYTYPAVGVYTTIVTATNSISQVTAETEVAIIAEWLYLPTVLRQH